MLSKIIFLLFLTLQSFGAEIIARPFSIDFLMKRDAYELDFKITLACRYEKFVISDSAEYEYIYKELNLQTVFKEENNEYHRVTLSLPNQENLKMTGYFKQNKECQSIITLFLKDKKYTLGYFNDYSRPIRLGFYKQTRLAEFKDFEVETIKDLLEGVVYGFSYTPRYNSVYVTLSRDGKPVDRMSTFARTNAAKDPETNMPFEIKKSPL